MVVVTIGGRDRDLIGGVVRDVVGGQETAK